MGKELSWKLNFCEKENASFKIINGENLLCLRGDEDDVMLRGMRKEDDFMKRLCSAAIEAD